MTDFECNICKCGKPGDRIWRRPDLCLDCGPKIFSVAVKGETYRRKLEFRFAGLLWDTGRMCWFAERMPADGLADLLAAFGKDRRMKIEWREYSPWR